MIPAKQPIMPGRVGNTATPTQTQAAFAKQPSVVVAIPDKPNYYFVEEGAGAYRVFWDGEKGWCACSEFQKNGRCTHIEKAKENPVATRTEAGIEKILQQPLPAGAIEAGRDGLKRIKINEIYKRLNEAFGTGNWSFELLKEPTEYDTEMVCNGRLTVYYYDRAGQRNCVCKEHTGTCGFADYGTGDNVERFLSFGEARTGAINMALRKCALMLGVGAGQQYDEEPPLNQDRHGNDQNPNRETAFCRPRTDGNFSVSPTTSF